MNQTTQQNAAMAEEASAACEALAHESDRLARMVAEFVVSADSAAGARPGDAADGRDARRLAA
jgi:hypothetical protein